MKFFKRIIFFIIIGLCIFSSQITAFADNQTFYYIGGFPLGFDLSGNGGLIVGLSEVICEDDIYLPAREAGLKSGDYIISLNGKKIQTASDIDEILQNYTGGCVIAEILSDGKKCIKNIYPKRDLSGTYKIGVLIRDYLSGIGTVTLISEQGNFASLGHPILDEEGNMLGIGGGFVYDCKITGVLKGERGRAGELNGSINRNNNLGCVSINSEVGLLGRFTNMQKVTDCKKYPIGEATPGNAEIYTTISGAVPKKYTIAIVKIDQNEKNNKNIVIKVTDDKLIRYTGGIVQGMSGSPIIQNGKIVGAVTHVFLNDSTRGYAISIDKMIDAISQL